jgi:hypothetical protein
MLARARHCARGPKPEPAAAAVDAASRAHATAEQPCRTSLTSPHDSARSASSRSLRIYRASPREELVELGELVPVEVEGVRGKRFVASEDVALLDAARGAALRRNVWWETASHRRAPRVRGRGARRAPPLPALRSRKPPRVTAPPRNGETALPHSPVRRRSSLSGGGGVHGFLMSVPRRFVTEWTRGGSQA